MKKGSHHSLETRKNLSESVSWVMKEKWQDPIYREKMIMGAKRRPPITLETRLKISKGNKGKIISLESREKLRQINLGKKQSPETIEKRMSKIRGKKQKPLSQEAKEKMRQAHLGKILSEEHKKKIGLASKRNWLSPEYRQNRAEGMKEFLRGHSITMKNLWQTDEYRIKTIKAIIKGSIKRPTSFEQKIIELIKKYNLPFKYVGDGEVIINYVNPDFINCNGKKELIEVYCRFWHPKNYEEVRSKRFERYGFKTLFLNEDDLNIESWESRCLEKIRSL